MENKTGKYFKYAIGEIVLVVIGILIALQINNWNENRKLNNKIRGVYSIIQNDLLSDIEIIDEVLLSTAGKDSIFKKIITKNLTYDDYKKCKECISIFGFPDITFNKRGIELLKENSTNFDLNLDSLSIDINKFYNYFNAEIDVAITEVTKDGYDNYSYFKNNKTWFEDFLNRKINDEFIEYALSSTDYRNRVNSFYFLYYKIYLRHLRDYRQESLKLIESINEKLK